MAAVVSPKETTKQPVHDSSYFSIGLYMHEYYGYFFSGSRHTGDLKLGTPVAILPPPGVIGSALGLVGPLSVYCDWV